MPLYFLPVLFANARPHLSVRRLVKDQVALCQKRVRTIDRSILETNSEIRKTHWTAFAVRYSTCQTPQAVWPRGSGGQVPVSLPRLPCSQIMHMAHSQELEAASRSSET